MRRSEMRAGVLWVCVIFLFAASAIRAQQPDQEAIGLSAEQKDYFKTEIRQAQMKFTELQWKLQDEMEKLVSLARQPRVDESQTLAQLEKVLAAEREIKREQVTLLVRIKNKLTPEQQGKLLELRNKPAYK